MLKFRYDLYIYYKKTLYTISIVFFIYNKTLATNKQVNFHTTLSRIIEIYVLKLTC